ncbi:MAG TPA: hypothetical protein VNH64_10340 [Parvularculaceae bacterium]|nr:hypothetical protein [Parvularculaceae bacterium]
MIKFPSVLLLVIAAFAPTAASAGDQPKAAAPPPAVAPAQMPDTEILVASLSWRGSRPQLHKPYNATNHKGYDNQPWFLPGADAFLFVSEGESGKTDIWRYDIKSKKRRRLFFSPKVSEYSPRLAPDGARISYVQENEAGDMTRVSAHSLDGADEGAPIINFAPLGYYAWLDGGAALAVYYRSEPARLYRVDIASGDQTLLYENIGRALQSDATGAHLWFTAAPVDAGANAGGSPPASFTLMRYDSATGSIAKLFELPAGDEDYAVAFSKSGSPLGVFAASGGAIYFRTLDENEGDSAWERVVELSSAKIGNATRLAVSDDLKWIAIVGAPTAN